MDRHDRALMILLRLVGAAELAALPFVLGPRGWMEAVHADALGLGPFPAGPLTEYLARHLSAVYALHGALFVAVSFDVPRFRPIVLVLGWGHVALGVALTWTDIAAGFRWEWAAAEGTIVGVCGGAAVALGRQRRPPRAVG